MSDQPRHIQIIIANIASGASALLNLLLLPLIYFHSSKFIGKYKYFLIMYTSTGMLYSLAYLLCIPMFHHSSEALYIYGDRFLISRTVGDVLIYLFLWLYGLLNIVICASFIYRFVITCRPHWPATCSPRTGKCLFALLLLFVFLWLSVTCAIDVSYPDADAALEKDTLERLNRSIYTISYIGGPKYLLDGSFYWAPKIAMASFSTLLMVGYSTIAVVAYKTYKEMVGVVTNSSEYHRYQRTLFLLLIFQTLCPFTFHLIPGVIITIIAFFNTHTGIHTYCSMVMTFSQVIDPLLIALSVKDYRSVVLRLLLGPFGYKPKSNVLPVSTTMPQ